MEYTFVQNPSWSTSATIDRIETKLRRVRDRATAIASQRADLEAEALVSAAFERDLVERLAVERRKAERNRPLGVLDFPSADLHPLGPPPTGLAIQRVPIPTVRSTSVHTGSRRYDSSTKLFSPDAPCVGGSHRPLRLSLTPDAAADAEILRLRSVLETPGLMHFMIMSEKAQSECCVEGIGVIEAALGLPLAEAFIDSVFSVEILPILANPAEAPGHLAKLLSASQARGGP